MNKTELAEIKRMFAINRCTADSICGCYVGMEKEIKAFWQQTFLSMDEEEILKYLGIFRSCLTGGLDKNLINLQVAEEKQEGLLGLRDCRLKNTELVSEFCENIIRKIEWVGAYSILMLHGVYDVPGIAKDGTVMEDASEEVYEYLMLCICPVNASKPGLSYHPETENFTHAKIEQMLGKPVMGFLYPAFNDRSEDRDSVLFYGKVITEQEKKLAWELFQNTIEISAEEEKEFFKDGIKEIPGLTMEEVRTIEQELQSLYEEHKMDSEPYTLDREGMNEVLQEIDCPRAQKAVDFWSSMGGKKMKLKNIVTQRDFSIKTDNFSVSVKPQYAETASVREIEGEECLVLQLPEKMKVNGIEIHVGKGSES